MSLHIVSVIVPCFNQGEYLAEALDSVLAQTYSNWQCVIINDGSNDNTDIIAKDYLSRDSRFKYILQENKGLSAARNAGLKASTGDFVQFLDADDFLHHDKLMAAVTAIINEPELKLVLSNYQLYDDQTRKFSDANYDLSKPITYESIIKNWDLSFAIPIHCGLFERNLLIDGFNEILRAKEDWLMWIKIFDQIMDYYFIKDAHVYYRMHDHSMIKNYQLMQKNTLAAYQIIHQMTSNSELKDSIFRRYVDLTSEKIKSLEENYRKVLASNSYKTGNLLLTPLSIIKNWVKK